MKSCVVVYSGGLDSTTLLFHLRAEGYLVHALSANYGQRHAARELAAGDEVCRGLGVSLRTVDLSGLASCFGGNALIDRGVKLPEGEYSADTIGTTTVANRNMVLLSVGLAWCSTRDPGSPALAMIGGG